MMLPLSMIALHSGTSKRTGEDQESHHIEVFAKRSESSGPGGFVEIGPLSSRQYRHARTGQNWSWVHNEDEHPT